jgi:hypothetical protein
MVTKVRNSNNYLKRQKHRKPTIGHWLHYLMKETKDTANKIEYPIKVKDKDGKEHEICFHYLMAEKSGRGCGGFVNWEKQEHTPCNRTHIDIDAEAWTKDTLKPLVDTLKHPEMVTMLKPTQHLKDFVGWTE